MYHEAAKISWERFYGFYPFRNRFFLNPWVHPEFYKNCGSCGGWTVPVVKLNQSSSPFQMHDPQFLKWSAISEKRHTPQKKASLTPQKSENEVPKKSLSSNPPWHVHFAKNQVQFGIFWPLEPHFWSTPPYRGSPPCAIFPIPDTEKYSTAMC